MKRTAYIVGALVLLLVVVVLVLWNSRMFWHRAILRKYASLGDRLGDIYPYPDEPAAWPLKEMRKVYFNGWRMVPHTTVITTYNTTAE